MQTHMMRQQDEGWLFGTNAHLNPLYFAGTWWKLLFGTIKAKMPVNCMHKLFWFSSDHQAHQNTRFCFCLTFSVMSHVSPVVVIISLKCNCKGLGTQGCGLK